MSSQEPVTIPQTMRAVHYHAPRDFEILDVPTPQVGDTEVLIKGICGTDGHIHEGEFIAAFPLIPGHEVAGTIAALGPSTNGFAIGDRVVADPSVVCESCYFCRRGQPLLCENYLGKGCNLAGGFAEYVTFQAKKVYKITSLTDEEATLVEPTACAVHGMDKLAPYITPGADVLVLGAGPTGLVLAQLLRLNGAARVVVAANKGIKTDLASRLGAGDEILALDRGDADAQWAKLKEVNPYGFDVVVEATGSESVAHDAIKYVRRGGTLMTYGVYANSARVHWAPVDIFQNEIRIIGSFAQMYCFPRAIAYLESGKISVKGMVTDVYTLDTFQSALDKMNSRTAVKIAVKPF
ncbi:NADP+-dependent D-mannitol dehydrogenase [Vararia minispora EC-137]|uniref:NADP+-dependent D-mannitol dehydrogenase n=1 Tax=Vararia minispora EC-137 TaxID=1314806 RepID=A0ACB8QMN2_9AGAM|nr:NADP+-dependent D-mannitol dehydrogenase [Vararia minispora EC-137]